MIVTFIFSVFVFIKRTIFQNQPTQHTTTWKGNLITFLIIIGIFSFIWLCFFHKPEPSSKYANQLINEIDKAIDKYDEIINNYKGLKGEWEKELKIVEDELKELVIRSRGTPRIANCLFRRVRDFADIYNKGVITFDITKMALEKLGIDKHGLNNSDYFYLKSLIEKFDSGPVGIENIAATIGEEISTIKDIYEPYLLQKGYIKRTKRGRVATLLAFKFIKNTK